MSLMNYIHRKEEGFTPNGNAMRELKSRIDPKMYKQSGAGFTLIEVLLVIAILAILASVVIIAINPRKQIDSAHDAQRRSDVFAILNALHQYSLDNGGAFPDAVGSVEDEICRTDAVSCDGFADLSELTDSQKYMVSMPIDPQGDVTDNSTGYYVSRNENGRITVTSYGAGDREDISVTR